ncbi:MAG: hypothetical protein H6Q73_2070 [Firmicutes bacterium]|nr:hypothetical protein [Bacillota bacterium]
MRVLLVFLVALTVFLPFNAYLTITDPVEANYALTAKEMLANGDWLSPRIYGQFWYDKPAMFYWLIMLGYKAFGVNEFAARFPSALFSAASVSFIYWFGRRIFGSSRAGIFAAVALATSLQYWVMARMVITDAVLFFYFSVALAALYLGLNGQSKKWYIVAYACAGLAVLTKGPMGIVLPALIVFVYIIVEQRWELFGKLYIIPGMMIFSLVALPWFVAMYKVHGQPFIDTFFGLHNYLRATVSEHPKDNVFYYYLVLFPVSLLPWTGVFFHSLIGKKPKDFNFLVVWLGVIIGFFTLMATKYPTYVFPASFPAALIIGWKIDQMLVKRHLAWWWLTIPALLFVVAFGVGVEVLPGIGWGGVTVVSVIAAMVIMWMQLYNKSYLLPWSVAVVAVALSLVTISSEFIPLAKTHSAKNLVQYLPSEGAIIAAYGDYSASAVFYSGYSIPRLVESEEQLASKGVWAGKYTMPSETTKSFAVRTANVSDTYILVSGLDKTPLEGFSQVAMFEKMKLYKRNVREK